MARILIAGPTASGKSALALALAERFDGTIINTDSMQIYEGLRVLTARPSAEEEARAPHFLYGTVDPAMRCSVGDWVRMAEGALAEVEGQGLTPIFVGGTGLYFRALTEGLSPIPDIPVDVRARAEARLRESGVAALYADVAARDPKTSSRLRPSDTQRVQRAWEVLEATGRGLASWHRETKPPLLEGPSIRFALEPDRDWLYERCNRRFDQMVEEGALDEVKALMARDLDPSLPAMKALGVRELAAYLDGRMSLEEAAEQAKTLTRRYAKRQLTWMRNQMADWPRLDPAAPDALSTALQMAAGEGQKSV